MLDGDRRRVNTFIVVVLLLQLALPVSYYFRATPADERFAWRMFSVARLQPCDVVVREQAPGAGPTFPWTRVDLDRAIHPGWQNALRQDVGSVAVKFLHTRCNLGARRARIDRICRDQAGDPVPGSRTEIDCRSDRLDRTER